MQITTIGLDIAKNVFQILWEVDSDRRPGRVRLQPPKSFWLTDHLSIFYLVSAVSPDSDHFRNGVISGNDGSSL